MILICLYAPAFHSVITDSLETQKQHFEAWIRLHSDWEYAGVFYDFGITGTKAEVRDGLQALLYECRIGRIDYVLTKSVSRFARNTVDCLSIVRELLSYGIPIYFEKENLDTGSMESELILSIISSLARLLKYVESADMLSEFSDELFTDFVENIIVYDRTHIGFQLKCGLTLKEELCTGTESKMVLP